MYVYAHTYVVVYVVCKLCICQYDTCASIHAVVCDPPCVQGACVENDTCHCAEAYEGPKCTEPGMYVCILT